MSTGAIRKRLGNGLMQGELRLACESAVALARAKAKYLSRRFMAADFDFYSRTLARAQRRISALEALRAMGGPRPGRGARHEAIFADFIVPFQEQLASGAPSGRPSPRRDEALRASRASKPGASL